MSEREIIDYAQECGLAAVADLLLLVGPDGFAGGYELFCDLERSLHGHYPGSRGKAKKFSQACIRPGNR